MSASGDGSGLMPTETTQTTTAAAPTPSPMCTSETAEAFRAYGLITVWAFSLVISIVLIIAQRRARFRPDGFYKGRPGLPIPVDFLVSPRLRFMYSILFAIMGTGIINGYGNFGNFLSLEANNVYTKVFNKILWTPFFTVLSLVLQYFPLFATVEFPHRRLGYCIGFVYSIVWFLAFWIPRFILYRDFVENCSLITNTVDRSVVVAAIFSDLPLLLLSVFVVFWFVYQMGFSCCWRPFHKYKSTLELKALDDWRRGIRKYHLDRVRSLLRKKPPKNDSTTCTSSNKILNKILKLLKSALKYLFPFKRNYKLPLPLLGAIVAMVMIVYQLSCSLISSSFVVLSIFAPYYTNNIKPLIEVLAATNPNSSIPEITNDIAGSLLIGVPVVISIAPFVSVGICIFLLIHMVSSMSKQIKKASKIGFDERLPNRLRRLSGFWKYIGLQLGLFITSWTVYTTLFSIVGLLAILVYFFLKYPGPRDIVFNFAVILLVPIIWAKLLFLAQTLICKFVFLEDKGSDKDAKFVPITNRRLYNWFAFVLFFYNGFAGLVGALTRIVINVMFSLVLMFRLDVLSLPKQFAWWDFGHKSYLSFIYMDYCYNNAVIHVFSHLLESSIRKDDDLVVSNVELVGTDQTVKNNSKNVQIRNRWYVAYTLIRNPSLQQYTANNIQLLQASAERDKTKTFSLEHTIRSLSEDRDVEVAFDDVAIKKAGLGEMGVEIQPNGVDTELGEDVIQGVEEEWSDSEKESEPSREGTDIPYQRWS